MLCLHYHNRQTKTLTPDQLSDCLQQKEGALWVDITGIDEAEIAVLRDVFKFHPLAIEDVTNQRQRPKGEEYDDYIFLIANTVTVENGDLNFHEVDIFVSENYMVTVHKTAETIIDFVRMRLEPERHKLAYSTSTLLHALLDAVIDSYLPLLEDIEHETDKIETMLIEAPNTYLVTQLLNLKSNLNEIWWVVWPYQNIISLLMSSAFVFQDEKSQYYLRDVSDHLRRITDLIHITRETVPSLINLYMSAISNRVNIAVNRLTIITIAIGVLAVVSGFYGMNFEHTWPPFGAAWGVPAVIIIMLSIVGVLYMALKERKLTE